MADQFPEGAGASAPILDAALGGFETPVESSAFGLRAADEDAVRSQPTPRDGRARSRSGADTATGGGRVGTGPASAQDPPTPASAKSLRDALKDVMGVPESARSRGASRGPASGRRVPVSRGGDDLDVFGGDDPWDGREGGAAGERGAEASFARRELDGAAAEREPGRGSRGPAPAPPASSRGSKRSHGSRPSGSPPHSAKRREGSEPHRDALDEVASQLSRATVAASPDVPARIPVVRSRAELAPEQRTARGAVAEAAERGSGDDAAGANPSGGLSPGDPLDVDVPETPATDAALPPLSPPDGSAALDAASPQDLVASPESTTAKPPPRPRVPRKPHERFVGLKKPKIPALALGGKDGAGGLGGLDGKANAAAALDDDPFAAEGTDETDGKGGKIKAARGEDGKAAKRRHGRKKRHHRKDATGTGDEALEAEDVQPKDGKGDGESGVEGDDRVDGVGRAGAAAGEAEGAGRAGTATWLGSGSAPAGPLEGSGSVSSSESGSSYDDDEDEEGEGGPGDASGNAGASGAPAASPPRRPPPDKATRAFRAQQISRQTRNPHAKRLRPKKKAPSSPSAPRYLHSDELEAEGMTPEATEAARFAVAQLPGHLQLSRGGATPKGSGRGAVPDPPRSSAYFRVAEIPKGPLVVNLAMPTKRVREVARDNGVLVDRVAAIARAPTGFAPLSEEHERNLRWHRECAESKRAQEERRLFHENVVSAERLNKIGPSRELDRKVLAESFKKAQAAAKTLSNLRFWERPTGKDAERKRKQKPEWTSR